MAVAASNAGSRAKNSGKLRFGAVLATGLAALLGFAVGIAVATTSQLAGVGVGIGGIGNYNNYATSPSPPVDNSSSTAGSSAGRSTTTTTTTPAADIDMYYAPRKYHIIGVRVASRRHLPASTQIPNATGTVHWYDVDVPISPNNNNNDPRQMVERRVALQRRHMIEALETYLPVACPSDEEWFLWIEDDVVPYPGTLRRVQAILLAIRQRYGTDGFAPAYVRLGVGLTAALLRCGDTHARLLPRLKAVSREAELARKRSAGIGTGETGDQEQGRLPEEQPVDQIVANVFRLPKGTTLNYETGLFGHSDAGGVASTIQSLHEHGSRSGNEHQKLVLSTNLAGPRFAFDVSGCLGYAWSPCPTRGEVWAPMSSLNWFDRQGDNYMVEAQPQQSQQPSQPLPFMVVHGKDISENCDAACQRHGTQCDKEGLGALNDPITFRQRSGVSCDGVYYRTAARHLPAFDPKYTGESDAPDGPITACYLTASAKVRWEDEHDSAYDKSS